MMHVLQAFFVVYFGVGLCWCILRALVALWAYLVNPELICQMIEQTGGWRPLLASFVTRSLPLWPIDVPVSFATAARGMEELLGPDWAWLLVTRLLFELGNWISDCALRLHAWRQRVLEERWQRSP